MEVIHLNLSKKLDQPIAVALGYFDGLHLGHQAVIKEVVDYAKAHQMRSAVMTFSPSPNIFLKKLDSERLLTPYQEKVSRLTELGVDELIILPFNEALANMRAIDFVERYSDIREVTIEGKGQGTVSLIKETIAIRDKSNKEFDRVWAVFDKDDFNDFNDAIQLAKKNHILCAWSNESFELWYYLHFQYLDTGISRSQYIEKIEREIQNRTNDSNYRYKKKSPETFDILQRIGDESLAIKHAQRLRESFSGTDYAAHKPCTTVYELVEELTHPEKLL